MSILSDKSCCWSTELVAFEVDGFWLSSCESIAESGLVGFLGASTELKAAGAWKNGWVRSEFEFELNRIEFEVVYRNPSL